jgi:zinc D-Ala-D-Ala carboxypeptidase
MKISNYITIEQACKSETAIRKGIENVPNDEQLEAMRLLCEKVYDPLCKTIGRALPVTSFFRSIKLNKAIGGSSTSQHCKGEAVDIDCDGTNISNKTIFELLKAEFEFDQLINEFPDANGNPAWVHVSWSKNGNRGSVLKAIKVGGKTKYVNY